MASERSAGGGTRCRARAGGARLGVWGYPRALTPSPRVGDDGDGLPLHEHLLEVAWDRPLRTAITRARTRLPCLWKRPDTPGRAQLWPGRVPTCGSEPTRSAWAGRLGASRRGVVIYARSGRLDTGRRGRSQGIFPARGLGGGALGAESGSSVRPVERLSGSDSRLEHLILRRRFHHVLCAAHIWSLVVTIAPESGQGRLFSPRGFSKSPVPAVGFEIVLSGEDSCI